MTHPLTPFFAPKGVALVGASSYPAKLSYGILQNMRSMGYTGGVYPVNPQYTEILGQRCYPDVIETPDPIDAAVVILPAPVIPGVLEACGRRGIRSVIIISGGFKEVGGQGSDLEAQCLEIARRYQMRLVGPNCVGIMDLFSGFNSTFIKGAPERGPIGFVSQSGAVCGGVVDFIVGKGIGFSTFISLGNEADLTETDMIEYLGQDENTRVIAAYVEAIRDGQRFIQVARQVARRKPIVLLKAGRTQAGAKAVSSHTGSLAGSHAAYQAAFRQAGVIEVQSAEELFDVSHALASQPLPAGNRVAIITNAGGPAALASDSLAINGLTLSDLSPETQANLRQGLVSSAQVSNPVDMLGGAEPREYAHALQHTLKDDNVDAVIAILVPQALVSPVGVAQAIVEQAKQGGKPVLSVIMGEQSVPAARLVLHQGGVPMYIFPEHAGRALGAMRLRREWLSMPIDPPKQSLQVDNALAARMLATPRRGVGIGEADTRPLLETYGIPVIPGAIANTAAGAAETAEKLGFPVALKIVSDDILHKSDAGGIRLNLGTPAEVETGFHEMLSKVRASHSQAKIDGVLVEKMASKGVEVIVGMKRDPNFGPLLMFGLGGIFVEIITDVAFRVAPLSRRDAVDMIAETRAGRMLKGLRGQPPADMEACVDVILRIAQFALDFPQVAEIEINPLLVLPAGQGAVALDGRIILTGA
ncbi:MAG TPA: acetate--CoA ligase family protein [Anaerolineaceae bacterium]